MERILRSWLPEIFVILVFDIVNMLSITPIFLNYTDRHEYYD